MNIYIYQHISLQPVEVFLWNFHRMFILIITLGPFCLATFWNSCSQCVLRCSSKITYSACLTVYISLQIESDYYYKISFTFPHPPTIRYRYRYTIDCDDDDVRFIASFEKYIHILKRKCSKSQSSPHLSNFDWCSSCDFSFIRRSFHLYYLVFIVFFIKWM